MTANELIALLQALSPEHRQFPVGYDDSEYGGNEIRDLRVRVKEYPGETSMVVLEGDV